MKSLTPDFKGTAAERRAARQARLNTQSAEEAARIAARNAPRHEVARKAVTCDQMLREANIALEDAQSDFPDVCEDDLWHDMTQAVMWNHRMDSNSTELHEFARITGVELPW